MATQDQDLTKLSDTELDSLIMHGINQQETVVRHGAEYQHLLNVVAAAKKEKATRGTEEAAIQREGAANKKIADSIPDTFVVGKPTITTGRAT